MAIAKANFVYAHGPLLSFVGQVGELSIQCYTNLCVSAPVDRYDDFICILQIGPG
jgi:hypothetical protein